jgi:hypothetical protein
MGMAHTCCWGTHSVRHFCSERELSGHGGTAGSEPTVVGPEKGLHRMLPQAMAHPLGNERWTNSLQLSMATGRGGAHWWQ